MNEFTKDICDELKYYVYTYIDPRDNKIFYVGKGNGNRAFSHLSDTSENEKVKRINEIKDDGQEPEIEIIVHGLSDEIAKRIEASIIDIIGIDNLTNINRGYESKTYGRKKINQIIATYAKEKVTITEPAILININKTFHYGMKDIDLYDGTRSAWVVGEQREKAKYAFAIYAGIVQEVYKICGWFRHNSTLNSRKIGAVEQDDNRWEFIFHIPGLKPSPLGEQL